MAILKPIAHNSPIKMAWDLLILLTVLVFTFLISYRLVFRTFQADWLYYFLNTLFLLDIVMGFVVKIKLGHLRLDTFAEIRAHYLHTWFTIDALAFFPFESIPVLIYGKIPTDPLGIQIYLGLQALTLIKLLKSVRLFQELQEAFGLSPSVIRLVSFGYWFSQAIHFMALGWILIGGSEGDRPYFDQYLRSFYWVTTTIATIGYGDYGPDHDSNQQIFYTIVVEIFGVGMYTYMIANVTSLVQNIDVARATYQKHMEGVNAFLRAQKVPFNLQERVRDYYSYLWQQTKSISERSIIEDLPSSLSMEILMHQNRKLIEKVDLFKDSDELFIREAVQMLRARVFLPLEYVIRQGEYGDCMYFLTSGSLKVIVGENEVATLGAGSVFGETALVKEERRNASIRAVTYGTGYQLSKHDFSELRLKYPDFDERVKSIVAEREKK